ncbi:Na+/melibiose symporter-like transporter [Murinocardiopsis flavida]|uniref:Na+/melibiose symporter-like transporter n=1 Tax=Murinocardiopsis flavida TaxID=645275 RepID=A0A2P8CCA2_9ACTN|nr:MFS transporter [Murinocardiopsis flavida]PSK82603.1 Na+/melibiose symporter-like transporter [Murinocardiopsis flavida]
MPWSRSPSSTPPLGRPFARFWAAYSAANLADGMLLTAVPLLAATFTRDPLLISGLSAARFLPWLLLAVLAGVLSDRWERRRTMITANAGRSGLLVLLAVLLYTGNAGIGWLYAVLLAVVTCEVAYDTAGRALLPSLVERSALDRANGRLESGRTIVEDFGGAPLAGALFAVAAVLPMVSIGGAYVVGALLLVGLPLLHRPAPPAPAPAAEGARRPRSIRAEAAEGLRHVWHDTVQRDQAILGVCLGFGNAVAVAVLVLVITERLGVAPAYYGLFLAASPVGALFAIALLGGLVRRYGRGPVIIGGMLLFGASWIGLAAAPNPLLGAFAFGVCGFGMTLCNVLLMSVFQIITPGTLLGRVTGIRRTFTWGLMPVGAVVGGLLGRVDLGLPLVAGGALLILVVLLSTRQVLRAARRAAEIEADGAGAPAQDSPLSRSGA